MNNESSQKAVIHFLSQVATYGEQQLAKASKRNRYKSEQCERQIAPSCSFSNQIQQKSTHCAHVFMSGQDVYKIKRAVTYTYLDMSALDSRKKLCEREFVLNKDTLPDIYLEVVPITTESDGRLKINGSGEPVEWALHMKRFRERDVLDNLAQNNQLSCSIAGQVGQSIAKYHATLNSEFVSDGFQRIEEVVLELITELTDLDCLFPIALLDQFVVKGRTELQQYRTLLNQRAISGFVRRCHGDLHLRNIVMHHAVPLPFDALEFDERMATTDILYDLAFLLMDLDHRGLALQCNAAFNQYLLHSDEANLNALRLLPLFLFCRAGIRAMTTAQASRQSQCRSAVLRHEARQYLELALDYLGRQPPALVAVGGLSGSGKSTVSARLAPEICCTPGAILIRSDAERKAALGVNETSRLSAELYTADTSHTNYQRVLRKAKLALDAGQSVIVDAVFLDQEQRKAIEKVAHDRKIPFVGIWLQAPVEILEERVSSRCGDASDATVAVLNKQVMTDSGSITWSKVTTSGSIDQVFDVVSKRVIEMIKEPICERLPSLDYS